MTDRIAFRFDTGIWAESDLAHRLVIREVYRVARRCSRDRQQAREAAKDAAIALDYRRRRVEGL